MRTHEQFAEELARYALGEVQGEERADFEIHLETCANCRRELEQLRGDMALLSLAAGGPAPPQRARQRLMTAISREPREQAVVPRVRRSYWGLVLPWAAAAAFGFAAFLFWRESDRLSQIVAKLQADSLDQQSQLDRARDVVATLTASNAMVVPVTAPDTPPQPQGKAIYLREKARLIFVASNMPVLPPQKAYELWVIPFQGAPIPAGVFKPDVHGSAIVVHPPLPLGTEAKAFAVTVEPEQGSQTPTMPIVMMGAGE